MHGIDFLCPECPDGPNCTERAPDQIRPRKKAPTPEQVEKVREHFIDQARQAKRDKLVACIRAAGLAGEAAGWTSEQWTAVAKQAKVNKPSKTTVAMVLEALTTPGRKEEVA